MQEQTSANRQSSTHTEVLPSWLGIAAIVLVAIDLRPAIVSVGPVLNLIRQTFGLSHAVASLLTAIPDLLMGALALPTPWMARKFGRDRTILVALFLLCLSTLVRAFAQTTTALLFSTVGAGAGIAVTGALVAGFIKANYAKRAAVFMGIYATALSLGSTVSAALTGPAANGVTHTWRFATGMWGILGITAMAAWFVVAAFERRFHTPVPVVASKPSLPIRNRTAWLVAAYFALNNLIFYSIIAWLAPVFKELGASTSRAGLLLACFTAVFMFGNPVFGALSKHHDRRTWLAICSGLGTIGLGGFALAPLAMPFLFIPLAAFGLGGGFTLGMTLPLDNTHSVEEANVWNAFTLMVGYLVAAAGPILVGLLRDNTGSFHLPLWGLAGTAALMVLLTPFLAPHKILEEREVLDAQIMALENEL